MISASALGTALLQANEQTALAVSFHKTQAPPCAWETVNTGARPCSHSFTCAVVVVPEVIDGGEESGRRQPLRRIRPVACPFHFCSVGSFSSRGGPQSRLAVGMP